MDELLRKAIKIVESRTREEARVALSSTSLIKGSYVTECVCSVCGSKINLNQNECPNCGKMDIIGRNSWKIHQYVFSEQGTVNRNSYRPAFFLAEKDEEGNVQFAVVCVIYCRKDGILNFFWKREISVICSGSITKRGTLTMKANCGISKFSTKIGIANYNIENEYTCIDGLVNYAGIFPIVYKGENQNFLLQSAPKTHGMFKEFVNYLTELSEANSNMPLFAGVGVVMLGDSHNILKEISKKVVSRYKDTMVSRDNDKNISEEELIRCMQEYHALADEKVKKEVIPAHYALSREVTNSTNEIETQIYCSCGNATTIAAKLNASDKKSAEEQYRDVLQKYNEAYLSCPVCGRKSKLVNSTLVDVTDMTVPRSRIQIEIGSQKGKATILYVEKASNLPGDVVLFRYYDFRAILDKDSISEMAIESVRCFLTEHKCYLFVKNVVKNNCQWLLIDDNKLRSYNGRLDLSRAFSLQEHLEKILHGTILDNYGFVNAMKKGFMQGDDSVKDVLQIHGGPFPVMSVIQYPGIADLYQMGFQRIAAKIARDMYFGKEKILKPRVITASEMLATNDSVLTEIACLDERESLDIKDLKEIIKVTKGQPKDVQKAYWAAANYAIKEIAYIARACKVTFSAAARRVSEIAELELDPVDAVAKNLQGLVKLLKLCNVNPELPAAERYERDRKFAHILNWLYIRTESQPFTENGEGKTCILDTERLYRNRDKKFVRDALIFATGIIDKTRSPALRYAKIELTCTTDENDASLLKSVHVKIQDEEKKTEKTFSDVTG